MKEIFKLQKKNVYDEFNVYGTSNFFCDLYNCLVPHRNKTEKNKITFLLKKIYSIVFSG